MTHVWLIFTLLNCCCIVVKYQRWCWFFVNFDSVAFSYRIHKKIFGFQIVDQMMLSIFEIISVLRNFRFFFIFRTIKFLIWTKWVFFYFDEIAWVFAFLLLPLIYFYFFFPRALFMSDRFLQPTNKTNSIRAKNKTFTQLESFYSFI